MLTCSRRGFELAHVKHYGALTGCPTVLQNRGRCAAFPLSCSQEGGGRKGTSKRRAGVHWLSASAYGWHRDTVGMPHHTCWKGVVLQDGVSRVSGTVAIPSAPCSGIFAGIFLS